MSLTRNLKTKVLSTKQCEYSLELSESSCETRKLLLVNLMRVVILFSKPFISGDKTLTKVLVTCGALTYGLGASGPPGASKLEHVPIEHIVIGESLAMEQVAEQLPCIRVVWLLFKSEGSGVEEKRGELAWGIMGKHHLDMCHLKNNQQD